MPQVLKEVIKESVSKISLDVYVDLLSTAPRLAVGLSTFYRAFWQENPAFSLTQHRGQIGFFVIWIILTYKRAFETYVWVGGLVQGFLQSHDSRPLAANHDLYPGQRPLRIFWPKVPYLMPARPYAGRTCKR